jgi:hypothetical protein
MKFESWVLVFGILGFVALNFRNHYKNTETCQAYFPGRFF